MSLWWPSSSPNTELEKFREVPPRSEVLNEVTGQCIAMWRLITGITLTHEIYLFIWI